ncbi:hypothetical protein EON79_18910, partial [bacterium]
VFSYVKSPAVFRCPSDGTDSKTMGVTAETVSYGLNSNSAKVKQLAQTAYGSRSVLLFEITGNHARVTVPDEEMSTITSSGYQVTAIGDGTQGSLLSQIYPSAGPGDGIVTYYATGRMDNSQTDGGDDYKTTPPRHSEGANYVAVDGHAIWSVASQVSAGGNAKEPNDPQKRTGCSGLGTTYTRWPCAEGGALSQHKLTFSLQ